MNDPLASTLSNIWNAEKVGKMNCLVSPSSKIIKSVLKILKEHGYIGEFEEIEKNTGDCLEINLLGKINKCCVIKPRYPIKFLNMEKYEKRFLPAKDFGIIIVSTSKGIMTHNEAKEKKVGGRLLAYCY